MTTEEYLIAHRDALAAALENALEWIEIAQADEPEDFANPVLEEHIQQARAALNGVESPLCTAFSDTPYRIGKVST